MQAKLRYAFSIVAMLTACSGGGNKKNPDVGMGTNYDPNQTGISDSELDKQQIDDGSKPFDQEMAKKVLERGGRKVKDCGKTAEAPAGEGEVTVVFDGDAGKVVDVELPSMWSDASEAAQHCIRNAFIDEFVPPFDGGKKSVPYTVTIPEPGEEKKDEKKHK